MRCELIRHTQITSLPANECMNKVVKQNIVSHIICQFINHDIVNVILWASRFCSHYYPIILTFKLYIQCGVCVFIWHWLYITCILYCIIGCDVEKMYCNALKKGKGSVYEIGRVEKLHQVFLCSSYSWTINIL